ncbi:hypothetical protein PIROE2DRAFT_13620 [Piromyces sp. E2]|nr:hypothetical protein PIROE2DRAFT_13620 [Piromyces sp. E2]|eukprot:OUM60600.1 hypothetical protein PIROE2DRAFT_13620 [Piromyces sp. E2]
MGSSDGGSDDDGDLFVNVDDDFGANYYTFRSYIFMTPFDRTFTTIQQYLSVNCNNKLGCS